MSNSCGGCSEAKQKMKWSSLILAIGGGWLLVAGLLLIPKKTVKAENSCLTVKQVQNAETEMGKCLTIYNGGVYDFTTAKKWDLTGHVGQHLCGKIYDKATIEKGPHSVAVMDKFFMADICGAKTTPQATQVGGQVNWFRISAYASLVFFILNFATCYAMPWSRVKQPWEGVVPGHDQKDTLGRFPLTYWHKQFAWIAIFFLSVHGAMGFVGVLTGYWF